MHLHLKDFVTDPTAGRHHRRSTYIGEGEVPHEDIFRDLLKDGYDGPASIEHGVRHFEEGTESIPGHARNLKRIQAKVQRFQNLRLRSFHHQNQIIR